MNALLDPAATGHAKDCACPRCVSLEAVALFAAQIVDRIDQPHPAVMTVDQTAAYLQVSADTVRRTIRTRGLPATRVGQQYRIVRAHLDRWLTGDNQP